jgi:hypothetical protein
MLIDSTVIRIQAVFYKKNIPREEHPHRDLSTALPRISCGGPWL